MEVFYNLNMNGHEIQNVVLENLASDPTSGVTGRLYFNQTTGRARIDTGAGFKNVLLDSVSWNDLTDRPASFTPSTHSHAISEVTGLQDSLDDLAPTDSPQFTGNPTVPTQTTGNNSTRIATTAFVQDAVGAAGGGDMLKSIYDPDEDGKVSAAVNADQVPVAGVNGISSFARTFLDDTSATQVRGTLGLGSLATKSLVSSSDIADGTVTNADLINVATGIIKGRTDSGTGPLQDLTVSQVKTLLSIALSDVDGLTAALAGKSDNGHSHSSSDITDIQTFVDGRIVAYWNQIAGTDDDVDTIREVLDLVLAARDAALEQIARFNFDIGDGSSTSVVVSHALNSRDILCAVYRKSDNALVGVGIELTTLNTITISASPPMGVDAFRLVVKK